MTFETESVGTRVKKFFRKLAVLIIFAGILSATLYYFYRTWTISEGTREGSLYKISKNGKVFKTFEGQLILGGTQFMTKESIWSFSVENEAVYLDLQKVEGKKVRLFFKEKEDAFPWQGETDFLVYRVEVVQ